MVDIGAVNVGEELPSESTVDPVTLWKVPSYHCWRIDPQLGPIIGPKRCSGTHDVSPKANGRCPTKCREMGTDGILQIDSAVGTWGSWRLSP